MARQEDNPTGDSGGSSWFDQYLDPNVQPTMPGVTGSATGLIGGKYAGMDPRQAWQQATQELGYGAGTPQDQATLQKIADHLAQNGLPGFQATGADTISIPGGGTVDVLTSGNQWWWGPEGGDTGRTIGPQTAGNQYAQGPGAIPPPYQSQPYGGAPYAAPPLPANLQQPYNAPQWTEQFTAPTAEEARATPGYQFTLDQGQQAIQRSAAAKGSILNPGTLHALDRYSQGLADTTYGQTFDRAMQQYQSRYGAFLGNAQLGLQGRQQGFNEYGQLAGLGQQGYQNSFNQYVQDQNRRMNDYWTNYTTQSSDPWSRYFQLYSGGLQGALGTKTNTPVTSG